MWGIKTEARSACVLGGTDGERQRLQEGHYQKQVEKEVIATIISPSRNCRDFHSQLWESFTSLKVTQLWEDAGRSDKVEEEERLLNNSKNKTIEFLKFYCKKKEEVSFIEFIWEGTQKQILIEELLKYVSSHTIWCNHVNNVWRL